MPVLVRAALASLIRGAHSLTAPAVVGAVALGALSGTAFARQADNPQVSDRIKIVGDDASAWTQDGVRTVMIEKNVQISTDDTVMTADRAVVWLAPADAKGNYSVQIALLGNAKLVRGDITREAPELLVTSDVKPDVKLEVVNLSPVSKETDVHYLAATQLRRRASQNPGESVPGLPNTQAPTTPASQPDPSADRAGTLTRDSGAATSQPATQPTTRPIRIKSTVNFRYDRARMETSDDGNIAMVLSGKVGMFETKEDGSRTELQADNVVVFTRWKNIKELFEGDKLRSVDTNRDIDSVYLENDVQIDIIPAQKTKPEQVLKANRAIYDFGNERALLTDALLHSYDPKMPAPLVVRAEAMRKLNATEYDASHASVSTSSFATPAIKLSAKKVIVREESPTAKDAPSRTTFKAIDVTPRLYNVPVFFFPRLWGSVDDGQSALRSAVLTNSTGFGAGIESQWGLFQTLGTKPPDGLDAAYRLDYYSERGPGLGLDASYTGGFVNESTLQPWNYFGDFTAYGTIDDGADRLGKQRLRILHDGDFRGRVKWNHQQFLSDNWQVQARLGYTSDASFLEEWFRNEFRNGTEQDASLYLKHSQGSEVFSALLSYDLSKTATVADQLQETTGGGGPNTRYPVTVERLPEIQYHRIGDSVFDDRMTFLSNNSLAGLHFSKSYEPLGRRADGTGFGLVNRGRTPTVNDADVGIPSYAYTGVTDDYILRGDFRQELDYPMGDDQYRVVPYGVLRYTAYSDSPDGDRRDRVLGGVGLRASTQFYKVYDGVSSDLLDIHRLRHIVEPQLNLFASAQGTDRTEVFQYDEGVDGVSDILAANFNIRQRFQTKRGAPGRQRSVDFLTINTGVSLFANEPDEISDPNVQPNFVTADGFRGLFYSTMPEASIPRSTAYADARWRVTDTTAVLSDISWNTDKGELATSAVGLAVSRDPRARYYVGVRYIGEMNSAIGTFSFDYDISERYSLSLNQTFNFNQETSQSTNMQLIRRFEQFIFTFTVYFDHIDDEGGISFSVTPRNLPFAMGVSDGNGGRR